MSAESPVLIRKGYVHSVAAQLVRGAHGRGVPAGDLVVTWKRSRCMTLLSNGRSTI